MTQEKLEILYEDRNLTVCCKPAGVQSEDAGANAVPALLRAHWGKPEAYVGVVHRLDLPTRGVMVYARNPRTAAELSRRIAAHEMQKEYLCVCRGCPTPREGEMEDYLFKDRSGKVFPVKTERKGAKFARLTYRVEATDGEQSRCRVTLDTGRTHQIRVQFASRRHPLHGDGKYGSRVKGALALCCVALTFPLPGEDTPREFALDEPTDGAFALLRTDEG